MWTHVTSSGDAIQCALQSFAATAAELDKLLADESSDDDDWLARRRATAQEEQDMIDQAIAASLDEVMPFTWERR